MPTIAVTIPGLGLSPNVLLGLFIQFTASVAGWLLVTCLVAFIIAKIRKAESTKAYYQKAAWITLILAIISIIPHIYRAVQERDKQPTSSARLTDQQVSRFQEILKGVMEDPSFLTPFVRQEFQQLLAKTGYSPAQIQDLREKMTGVLTTYQPLLWQDALIAFQTGKPHKSRQREDYEKRMIAKGLIPAERINKNNSLLSRIAAREPVPWQGQQVVLDEDAIRGTLNSIQETATRIDGLFPRALE
ncbi:MAG: hypothetical protein V2B18_25195 [Pseudomonadota bacterium]